MHVSIDGKTIQFCIDTGADASLLNAQSWECLGSPRLSVSQGRLQTASGKVMAFKGICAKTVQFRNSLADIKFYVKERVGTNLLGMDWIRKVDLQTTCTEFLKSLGGPAVLPVEVITPIALNKLLYEFSDIFQDKLGCCSEKASIQVCLDADLKTIPFRRPLMHLRKQIEVELERLVEREVLEPVNNALCAFPTVNVVKQSGSVRICGDFKPLNKFMVVDQHSIPQLSDLFTVLVGGQKFSN